MKNKNKFWREVVRKFLPVLLLFLFLGQLGVAWAERTAVLNYNASGPINLFTGAKANGGSAKFSDTNGGTFSLAGIPLTDGEAIIDNGSIKLNGEIINALSFTTAGGVAGNVSVLLRAPDSGAPGGIRWRRGTISASYNDQGGQADLDLRTSLSVIEDTPPTLAGTAEQTGFDLQIKPLITLKLNIPAVSPFTGNYSPSNYPVSGYYYRVTDANGKVVEEGTKSSATFSLDPGKFPQASAATYTVQAYAYNSYTKGHGGDYDPRWSPAFTFTTFGLERVGGTEKVSFTFALKKADPKRLVVNSIAIPPGLKYLNSPVTKASQLAALINAQAGTNVVTILGKWDHLVGSPIGFNPQTREGVDFNLEPGVGYQVYVNRDLTLKLDGGGE